MGKKKTGWPFQNGFLNDGAQEIHLFTDYRWNDGSVSRRWHVDPERFDACLVELRPGPIAVSLLGFRDDLGGFQELSHPVRLSTSELVDHGQVVVAGILRRP